MKKITKILVLLVVLVSIALSSCQKEIIEPQNATTSPKQIFTVTNGRISVKTDSLLCRLADSVNNMDSIEYSIFLRQNHIKETMYTIYHKAVTEDEKIENYYCDSLKVEGYADIKKHKFFSDYTLQMAKKGYLNLINNDTMSVVKMPTWATAYSKILTPKGEIKVGNYLYRYTNNNLIKQDLKTGKFFKNNIKYYNVDWNRSSYVIIPKNYRKKYKIVLNTRFVQYKQKNNKFNSVYVVILNFYKVVKIFGKWRIFDKNTSWQVSGYYNREFTTKYGKHIYQKENVFSTSGRSNYFEPVWASFGGNLADYIHVFRIANNLYEISTNKGKTSISHPYPSDRLK
jgi:hypothetical protein